MRVAIHAGTFDPITRGHLSVVERSAALFDRVVVVVAVLRPGVAARLRARLADRNAASTEASHV